MRTDREASSDEEIDFNGIPGDPAAERELQRQEQTHLFLCSESHHKKLRAELLSHKHDAAATDAELNAFVRQFHKVEKAQHWKGQHHFFKGLEAARVIEAGKGQASIMESFKSGNVAAATKATQVGVAASGSLSLSQLLP